MSPKYQIFISSTYEDLKAERDQVIKAVLEMGHIPVGMEMFSAADEEQWKIIQRQIDSSDYYVVIVAHRYGSMTDGISYTEKEYDYAISQGIPALGFVIDGSAEWPHEKYDTEIKKKRAMELFKKKVKAKPVNFWKSADDLHAKVAVALMKTFNTQPRPGWVRTTETTSTEVSEEIARLSKENSDLRHQIKTFNENDKESHLKILIPFDLEIPVRIAAFMNLGRDDIENSSFGTDEDPFICKFQDILISLKLYLASPIEYPQPLKYVADITVAKYQNRLPKLQFAHHFFRIAHKSALEILRILSIHNIISYSFDDNNQPIFNNVTDFGKKVLASLPE